ncbi:MAG: hypothetical protein ACJA1B_001199 [Polaribacter sp.]|jgi:hypothetical protein
MSIIQNIKIYFNSKAEGNTTDKAPEDICPNCWGKQEWEGEFYKLNKGSKLIGNDQTYNNFINKIVESNVSGIVIHKDTYECKTCKMSYTQ